MRKILVLTALAMLVGPAFAENLETPAKPAEKVRSQDPKWLTAIERLRLQPRPGEISNFAITTDIADIYKLTEEQKTKIAALQDAYDAAILQKAQKWEEESKALRAEYEAKLVEALPEEKREQSKKLLDLSHAHWQPTL